MKNLVKYRGCLIGGAVGDALGYAVEFQGERDIFFQYGKGGITEYVLRNGMAEISDDTQMTLFTAEGLLCGSATGLTNDINIYPKYILAAYRDWYKTQTERYPLRGARSS